MMGGAKAHDDCIAAFSETDFTEDLKAISVLVLLLHGTDDQVVPIVDSAHKAIKLLRQGTLKTYQGLSRGTFHHETAQFGQGLSALLRASDFALASEAQRI